MVGRVGKFLFVMPVALLPMVVLLIGACGEGADVAGSVDAGVADADEAGPEDAFNHFEFKIGPAIPLQDEVFEVEVVAYSSSDDTERMSDYDALVSLQSSVGSLSAGATSQSLTNGRVVFSVTLDQAAPDVVLLDQ